MYRTSAPRVFQTETISGCVVLAYVRVFSGCGRSPQGFDQGAERVREITIVRCITLQDLETHLWEAAVILRGAIDSSDYKTYILALVFYKRLSDLWEEACEAVGEPGDETPPASAVTHLRFRLPPGSSWREVRRHRQRVGHHLNAAFQRIEAANPGLRGLFRDVGFHNRARFPDATWHALLQHFDGFRLRRTDCEADLLGQAYEYLIAQFADDAGKKGGEFYTPKQVVRVMVACLKPQEGMTIYDPTCGSGGMLLACIYHLRRAGGDPKTLSLYGQEKNIHTWAISVMNLFLHDIYDASIKRGDTLLDPQHRHGKDSSRTLMKFDRVLANPPFSLKGWGHDVWKQGDPFGRDRYGCPAQSYGDLAFVQHMLASLKQGGMLGVVLPHGVLFRGGEEAKIRRGLLQDDLIEAVIGLAPKLFYGTTIPTCILILRKGKPAHRVGRVLFVQGAEERVTNSHQNHLSEANVDRLIRAFHEGRDEARFSRMVAMDEIVTQGYNLGLARYVPVDACVQALDPVAELKAWEALKADREAAEKRMQVQLRELGYGV